MKKIIFLISLLLVVNNSIAQETSQNDRNELIEFAKKCQSKQDEIDDEITYLKRLGNDLDNEKKELDSKQEGLDLIDGMLDGLRGMLNSPYTTQESINNYNNSVREYNQKLSNYKAMERQYNAHIKDYNEKSDDIKSMKIKFKEECVMPLANNTIRMKDDVILEVCGETTNNAWCKRFYKLYP